MTVTEIQDSIDDALCGLENMKGSLMVVKSANSEDGQNYREVMGQKDAIVGIVRDELGKLDIVISDLKKLVPKKDVED